MDSDSESKLVSLISQLITPYGIPDREWVSKNLTLVIQIISLVRCIDLGDSQQSKLMSLITQTISLFNSMDLDSLPKPLSDLISLISQKISTDSDQAMVFDWDFKPLVEDTLALQPMPELVSLIRQIVSVAIPMHSKELILLCPRVEVSFDQGKFRVLGEFGWASYHMWTCLFGSWEMLRLTGENVSHFRCSGCNGEYHKEYEKAPVEIKHSLHLKHSLILVLSWRNETRECYCCDDDLEEVFYYCSACDFAMNIVCVQKSPVLSIPPTKWHDHTLALFPRRASLTCNVCALADSSSPIYMCPPCNFVVHLRCIKLPLVIRISRHLHRIHYTPSFEEENRSCGVCRKKIDNDYGGYSCIKDGCLYTVHSLCGTQSNIWDGIDLEGEPEETEEEVVEPFVRISDGIIQHFSHEHHLRLDENTYRDYDENRLCQACVTPIYFGNFYSCVQCLFVLHETCANLACKIYHPIHPHLLTLVVLGNVIHHRMDFSGCDNTDKHLLSGFLLTSGFLYECGKEKCDFKLHVLFAAISEPLVHESHKKHPLFLTSKPSERRTCCVCLRGGTFFPSETFNCIECNGFALCFKCAAIPQKVRYKHDKHILTLSYGQEETSTLTNWCEACETDINPKVRFYMCDEYCSVTLHMECLIGRDLYMKPGSSFSDKDGRHVSVLRNNHHMSRPFCSECKRRCSQKIVFQVSGSTFCSLICKLYFYFHPATPSQLGPPPNS